MTQARLDPTEEISRAFEYGAKCRHDPIAKLPAYPPEHWPDEAKAEWCNGYDWADETLKTKWGKYDPTKNKDKRA